MAQTHTERERKAEADKEEAEKKAAEDKTDDRRATRARGDSEPGVDIEALREWVRREINLAQSGVSEDERREMNP